MPDIKEIATRPIGPLPAFAWVIVVVGGYFGYRILSGRSGSSSTTATTVGASTAEPGGTLADFNSLQSQIKDIQDKLGIGANPTPIEPGNPVWKWIAPFQTALLNAIPKGGSQISLIDPVTGKLVLATQKTYQLGEAVMTALGPAHLVTQNGQTFALLDRNFTIAKSAITPITNPIGPVPQPVPPIPIKPTATQILKIIPMMPVYGNNTATPRPVAMPTITPSLGKIAPQPTMPTFGHTAIPVSSLNIPTTTPVKSTAKPV